MALHFTLLLSITISLFSAFSSTIEQINLNQQQLIDDLDAAKLKIAQLETVLDESIQNVEAKTLYLKEREGLIQDAESQIRDLQSALSSVESGSSSIDTRISELEKEVKLLWAALRKSNFDLHLLEDKAREAEDRVEATALEVEKMSDIVTERWIQVQHLEQMREFNARRHSRHNRCTFLKVMDDLWEKHLLKAREMFDVFSRERNFSLESYLSQVLLQLKGFWAALAKYHHQLQGFIKHEMERNEITAVLANREVVFFVASALITFPVLGAWMLLLS